LMNGTHLNRAPLLARFGFGGRCVGRGITFPSNPSAA